jgi:hypothetical protein
MMPDDAITDRETFASARGHKETLYLRFFGQGAYRAVAIAVVDEFERDGEKWGEWRAYMGGAPRESEPYSWGEAISRAGLDAALMQVLDWGTKLCPEISRELFPSVERRHAAVRWAE